jgi:hypothetical protein
MNSQQLVLTAAASSAAAFSPLCSVLAGPQLAPPLPWLLPTTSPPRLLMFFSL